MSTVGWKERGWDESCAAAAAVLDIGWKEHGWEEECPVVTPPVAPALPFTLPPVLDNFNRADGALSVSAPADWGIGFPADAWTDLQILSNQIENNADWGSDYWKHAIPSNDQQVMFTVKRIGQTMVLSMILLRVHFPQGDAYASDGVWCGVSWDGAQCVFTQYIVQDNGNFVTNPNWNWAALRPIVVGDKLLYRVVGTKLAVWHYSAAGGDWLFFNEWDFGLTITGSYIALLNRGIYPAQDGWAIDDFAAGAA